MRKLLSLLLGCGVALSACRSGDALPDRVTWSEHVAPLLYRQCTGCHRPEANGHFNLVSYNDAKRYGEASLYTVKTRIMPPWPADPHYTQFAAQRVLTDREIALLEKWVKQGMPPGDLSRAPQLPEYANGSAIGKPDLKLALPPYQLGANAGDKFLLVKVPFELPKETNVSAIEFSAGPGMVVHHVNGDLVKYEPGRKRDVYAGERQLPMVEDSSIVQTYRRMGLPNDDGSFPALQKSVVNYLPGVFGVQYPEGIGGYTLPQKGAFLLNDIHYGYSRKDVSDSSYINIFFSKSPPKRPVQEFQIGTLGATPVEPDLVIPPNEIKHVSSRIRLDQDISVLTVNPHMHLLGKSFKAYALKPDGDTVRLISIPRWDFNWQYFYTFRKMVHLPAGTTVVSEGVYDNTVKNLNNPHNPPQLVSDRAGSMRASDEMFQLIITYLPYEPGDEQISLEQTAQP